MILPDTTEDLDFVIHEHQVGNKIDYQLSIKTAEDELQFLHFPRTGNMATISDNPNITRLFGELSEDTRSKEWLEFRGTTRSPEALDEDSGQIKSFPGVYSIIESGKVRIGYQTAKYSELFFNSTHITGRWILRKIPNIFEKSYLSDPEVYLLWKPPRQKDYNQAFDRKSYYNEQKCACGVKELSSKFHELAREEGTVMVSKLQGEISLNQDTQTFTGIGAAEGTWIDMFGNKYIYTPEFVVHTYNKQRDQVNSGDGITLNTEHPNDEEFHGDVTEVLLRQEPINHIVVNGVYTGPTALSEGDVGLSYEFRLRSVWNEDFQAWVPFDSITEKLSVVKRPACKICWITKVN